VTLATERTVAVETAEQMQYLAADGVSVQSRWTSSMFQSLSLDSTFLTVSADLTDQKGGQSTPFCIKWPNTHSYNAWAVQLAFESPTSVTSGLTIRRSDGATIRLRERGEAIGGGAKGDLYVHIRVKAHKKFTREGDLVLSEEHIGMVDAALGCEIDVATVDGFVTMKIPAGTQSGTDFKLSGHGVPHLNRDSRGAHIVSVLVDTPTKLSKKQRELLEEFDGAKKRGIFS
jgi:hypothetical protein